MIANSEFLSNSAVEFQLMEGNSRWTRPYSLQPDAQGYLDLNARLPELQDGSEFPSSLTSAITTTPTPMPKLWQTFNDNTAVSSSDSSRGTKICFGMLHKIRAKALVSADSFKEILHSSNKDETGNHYFKLIKGGSDFAIASQNADHLAMINDGAGSGIRSIWGLETIEFRIYVSNSTWNPADTEQKPRKKLYVAVNINIYGDSSIYDEVGRNLSSAKLYLQHPDILGTGYEYNNPHVVSIPNVLPNLTNSSLEKKNSRPGSELPTEPESTLNDFQNEIAVVFSSLTRASYLKRVEADIRIKTPLLSHQKEALDFMTQREIGPVPKHYSLWREINRGFAEQPCFEHIITGSKSQSYQVETGGGILADDMGLGKTLTCIAMITRTAQMATEFWKSGYRLQESQIVAADTAQYTARATLVIVPSQLLINSWMQEINKHVYGSLEVCIYHGRGREENPEILAKADVVFSTYHTIAAESVKPNGPLFQIYWFRVVLDEAHTIRSVSTKLYQTASKLDSKLRWCLTGTPVQNKLEDIGSLVSFLRIPQLDTTAAFRKHIIHPLMKGTGAGSENLRVLLDSICLRRSKNLLDLPDINVDDRVLEFSEAEREQYRSAELDMSRAIKHQVNLENTKKKFFGIFQLEMQLRRLCNHGTFQKPFCLNIDDDMRDQSVSTQRSKDAQCDYCKSRMPQNELANDLFNGHFTICGHLLCSRCLAQFEHELAIAKSDQGLRCPLCQAPINGDYLQQNNTAVEDILREDGVSSKVLGLLEDLKKNADKGKSIIFSGWTKSLDLIERFLISHQLRFERIDGSCSVAERNRVLDDFRKNPSTQILMMTTGTGAVGLNLAVANCVYILEPQWNPMVESQAIARVSRLGQKKKVLVVRYIMKGTVEETLRSQQLRKLALANVGWRNDSPKT
ncbi:SNF2 family N-terminal domain-containing protein [Xylogone sp. PMI_703]|nr:SNF2 family N-terminal domain-containing protein [Xylogone sp. PMI_703]